MSNFYRHGDISFHPAKKVEGRVKTETKDSYIVAYGEATGHHHELCGAWDRASDAVDAIENEARSSAIPKITIHTCDDGRRFVELDFRTGLTHPEHGLLTLEPGIYEIREERTFDYFENSIKKVID